jgi:hypothetical protein
LLLRLSQADLESPQIPIRAEDAPKIAGTVARGTNINQIRFEVFGSPAIAAGTLLSVKAGDRPVYYQTFQGIVFEEETLKGSSRGFVQGEAEQVGLWDADLRGFEAHDWVAKERSLVSVVDQDIAPPAYLLEPQQFTIGKIPGSLFPVNIDLNELVEKPCVPGDVERPDFVDALVEQYDGFPDSLLVVGHYRAL